MNPKYRNILKAMLAIVIVSGIAVNMAEAGDSQENDSKELKLFSMAKISLIDAIKAAEQNTGGKAMEAEVNDESNTAEFEVEILKDGKVYEVMVDGITGKVLKVALDKEDNESNEKE